MSSSDLNTMGKKRGKGNMACFTESTVKKVLNHTVLNFSHEEEREKIQRWRRKRLLRQVTQKRSYRHFGRKILLYSFSTETLKNFLMNFNFMVIFQLFLALVSVFIFQKLKIDFDIPVTLLISPIVFPLAFSINTDFQRREKVLEDLAVFKSCGMAWSFCMRQWEKGAGLDPQWLTAVHDKLKSLLFHLQEYLQTIKPRRRTTILKVMYEDFSDANQLIDLLRLSNMPANSPLISNAHHMINGMCIAFERLRVVREYRSPRTVRSFNKVFIFFLPTVLAPYFVHFGVVNHHVWQPYYIAIPVTLVLSILQSVQDKLDDPFDGMGQDDIKFDAIDEWTTSCVDHTKKREVKIHTRKLNGHCHKISINSNNNNHNNNSSNNNSNNNIKQACQDDQSDDGDDDDDEDECRGLDDECRDCDDGNPRCSTDDRVFTPDETSLQLEDEELYNNHNNYNHNFNHDKYNHHISNGHLHHHNHIDINDNMKRFERPDHDIVDLDIVDIVDQHQVDSIYTPDNDGESLDTLDYPNPSPKLNNVRKSGVSIRKSIDLDTRLSTVDIPETIRRESDSSILTSCDDVIDIEDIRVGDITDVVVANKNVTFSLYSEHGGKPVVNGAAFA